MDTQEELNVGIGTKETVSLKPAPVTITGIKIEMQSNKEGKEIGKKVVFICKHPEKDEPVEISSVKYIQNQKVRTSGTWYSLDEDKKINKQSALASLMVKWNILVLKEAEGKTNIETELDDKSYLCFKAY